MNLDILKQVMSLAAPNDENNATMAVGEKAAALLSPFVKVVGVVCNPTTEYPLNADLIPVGELREMGVKEDERLFLHVQVLDFAGRKTEIGVANWLRIVDGFGLKEAVIKVMDQVTPNWRNSPDGDFLAKVAELPGMAATVVEPPPVSPTPDWENPRGEGYLACRKGSNVKENTTYTSPSGIVWKASKWLSPFEMVWKRM